MVKGSPEKSVAGQIEQVVTNGLGFNTNFFQISVKRDLGSIVIYGSTPDWWDTEVALQLHLGSMAAHTSGKAGEAIKQLVKDIREERYAGVFTGEERIMTVEDFNQAAIWIEVKQRQMQDAQQRLELIYNKYYPVLDNSKKYW